MAPANARLVSQRIWSDLPGFEAVEVLQFVHAEAQVIRLALQIPKFFPRS
jgi:hypothetical protein